MKRWAIVVVALYLLTLVALTGPLVFAAFYPQAALRDLPVAFTWPQFWIWLALMVCGQAVMLLVPVSASSRRPVHRRAILWPVLASGLMMGLLAVGLVAAVWELLAKEKAIDFIDKQLGLGLGLGLTVILGVWLIWTFIFYRVNRGAAAMDVVTQQCRVLLKGSVLELLVAVPTHIVARYRDYCCAGFLTGFLAWSVSSEG